MNKFCFHHLSIAVDDLERARQFYTDVLEMQELERPPNFGHPGIWSRIPVGYRHNCGCVIPWKSGNYINGGLSKEEPKRGGFLEYFGRGR